MPFNSSLAGKQVEKRWTPTLIKAGGFTPVSIFFLENYSKLSPPLTHAEAMLVIHLMRHKFDSDAPYPGFGNLARRMGVTPTAVRGYARSLEKKGYLKREIRSSQTNLFHLEPLFARLEGLIPQKFVPSSIPATRRARTAPAPPPNAESNPSGGQ